MWVKRCFFVSPRDQRQGSESRGYGTHDVDKMPHQRAPLWPYGILTGECFLAPLQMGVAFPEVWRRVLMRPLAHVPVLNQPNSHNRAEMSP